MNRLLRHHIARLVVSGNLKVTGADGKVHAFGDGTGDPVHVVISSRRAEWAITLDPMLALPESYMNGGVDIVEGDVLSLLRLVYSAHVPGVDISIWTMRIAVAVRYVFPTDSTTQHAYPIAQQCASPL